EPGSVTRPDVRGWRRAARPAPRFARTSVTSRRSASPSGSASASLVPELVDGDAVALHPAVDLHARLAEFSPDGGDVPLVSDDQRAPLELARYRKRRWLRNAQRRRCGMPST